MVLADDNFATIVGAVEEGRRIYDNIRRAVKFLLGSNMSEVLSIFAATMLGFTILSRCTCCGSTCSPTASRRWRSAWSAQSRTS